MASKITMILSSNLLRVEAGGTATLTLTLHNRAFETEQYVIAVEGIDPFWYQASAHSVALAPQSESEIQLSLHPPRSGDVRTGPYPFAVKAISRSRSEDITTVEAVLQVEPFAGLEIELEPRVLTSTKERFQVRLTNWGESDSEVVLSGRDREEALQFDFQPSFVVLQPGQSVEVALRVRPKRGRWLRRSIERDFQVMAAPRGADWDSEQAHIVSGVLLDKPDLSPMHKLKLPRAVLLTATAVLLLVIGTAAWAATRSAPRPSVSNPAEISSDQTPAATSPTVPAAAATSTPSTQAIQTAGPPVIQRFVAQRAEDKKNVLLVWDVLDSEEVRLNGSIVSQNGSQPATMDRDGAYILVAKNKTGTSTSTVYVVMVCPPAILSFNVSPSTVQPEQSATLTWDSFGATQAEIDGRPVPVRGSVVVVPAKNTRYVLTTMNGAGTSQAEVSVDVGEPTPIMPLPTVPPAPTMPPAPTPVVPSVPLPPLQLPTPTPVPGTPPAIQSFTASPNLLTHWGMTTLSWNVSDATAVSIEPGIGPVDRTGTRSVVVSSSTSYVLTAVNASGQTSTATLPVTTIDPPYIAAFDVPARATTGSPITLSWNTTGTSSIVITWTDDQGSHSTQTFVQAAGTTQITPSAANPRGVVFTLTAKNQAGTAATAVRSVALVRP
ncbi:MAG: hypothetical protein EPO21_07680 [Chloroflexota bacterium]|nr:MAG: hypothetical protein EPO21_07680 [Chloroflexota bacterium]